MQYIDEKTKERTDIKRQYLITIGDDNIRNEEASLYFIKIFILTELSKPLQTIQAYNCLLYTSPSPRDS